MTPPYETKKCNVAHSHPGNDSSGTQWCNEYRPAPSRTVRGDSPLSTYIYMVSILMVLVLPDWPLTGPPVITMLSPGCKPKISTADFFA